MVHIGKRNAERLYLWLGLGAILIMIGIGVYDALTYQMATYMLPLYGVYIALHALTYHKMKEIGEGRELNKVLGMTARNIFVFGIMAVIAIIFSAK